MTYLLINEVYDLRFLVTGAAGFIGSHLCESLKGEVVGIDNFDETLYPKSVKLKNLDLIKDKITFRELDIQNSDAVNSFFKEFKFDFVYHLAAIAGVGTSLKFPSKYFGSNILGTHNVLEAIRQLSPQSKLIFASSSSVYGVQEKMPFIETQLPNPLSPYAGTKTANEAMIKSYTQAYGLHAVSLRFFTVYGPRMRPDLAVYKFAKKLVNNESIPVYGDGTQTRDFTFVSDIVDGLIKAQKAPTNSVINLGGGNRVNVNYLVELLAKGLGIAPNIEFKSKLVGDSPHTWADISKAKELLGWEPRVKIEDGITEFLKWFKSV